MCTRIYGRQESLVTFHTNIFVSLTLWIPTIVCPVFSRCHFCCFSFTHFTSHSFNFLLEIFSLSILISRSRHTVEIKIQVFACASKLRSNFGNSLVSIVWRAKNLVFIFFFLCKMSFGETELLFFIRQLTASAQIYYLRLCETEKKYIAYLLFRFSNFHFARWFVVAAEINAIRVHIELIYAKFVSNYFSFCQLVLDFRWIIAPLCVLTVCSGAERVYTFACVCDCEISLFAFFGSFLLLSIGPLYGKMRALGHLHA